MRISPGSTGMRSSLSPPPEPVEGLVGQHKAAEPLGGQVEGAVDAPDMIALPGERLLLRHGRGINQTKRSAAPGRRDRAGEHLTHQCGQPIATLPQPIEYGHIRDVRQPDRAGPGRGRSEAAITQAITQQQAEQIDRLLSLSKGRSGEGAGMLWSGAPAC
jgi:hypothetical protein